MKKIGPFIGAVAIIFLITGGLWLLLSPLGNPSPVVGEAIIVSEGEEVVLEGNKVELLEKKEEVQSFDRLVPADQAKEVNFFELDNMMIKFEGKNEPSDFDYDIFPEKDNYRMITDSFKSFRAPQEAGNYLVRVTAKWGYKEEYVAYEYFFGLTID